MKRNCILTYETKGVKVDLKNASIVSLENEESFAWGIEMKVMAIPNMHGQLEGIDPGNAELVLVAGAIGLRGNAALGPHKLYVVQAHCRPIVGA